MDRGIRAGEPIPSFRRGSSGALSEAGRFVTFEGFRGEPGPQGISWRQVRCLVKDGDLRIVSYWRRRAPGVVLPLRGAVLTNEWTSGNGDRNLKPGRMRVLEYRLVEGSRLLLAVSTSMADEVRRVLCGPSSDS